MDRHWMDSRAALGTFFSAEKTGTPIPRSFNLESSHYTDCSISALKSEQVETLSMHHL